MNERGTRCRKPGEPLAVVAPEVIALSHFGTCENPEAAFDLAVGFPVRWRPSPKLAVIAVDKLMTIHTDGRKPDLTVGVGLVYQIIPKLAALVRGEVTLFEFDTEQDPQVPATAALQFSPARKLDLGLEFTFGNVANEAGPLDDRFLLLYAQTRL